MIVENNHIFYALDKLQNSHEFRLYEYPLIVGFFLLWQTIIIVMHILSATCYVTDILKKDWRQKWMWLLISPPTLPFMLVSFLFYLFLPFCLGSLHLLAFFFPELYAYSSVPLQTSLPFFVHAAPHSFRGISSRFEWTCLGSTRHPPWKRSHCWPFLSITVFQAVPLCL